MREGSRRSTGLLSVYYCPLSAPKCAFCFDGLARGPLRAPRTPDAISFSVQRPIPLCPFLSFAAILLLLSYPLRPPSFITFSHFSYTPYLFFSPVLYNIFSPTFSYYTHSSFLFPSPIILLLFSFPIRIFYLRRPYPLKRRPCARVRCAHGATKQKGEWEK